MCEICEALTVMHFDLVEDNTLPLDTVEVRDGKLYLRDPGSASAESVVGRIRKRYALVHTSPPSFLDRSTGELVTLPTGVFPWLRGKWDRRAATIDPATL